MLNVFLIISLNFLFIFDNHKVMAINNNHSNGHVSQNNKPQ
ncbi:SVM family protein, predicted signal peptide [Candidatus Phytoplasma rubi]|uniref:SVM family protein, predicted signal peptide n=1 Tax=Candidatus Phytoplasma rubi TaxID=399025 RepID=A0ABY7BRD7_9MOLU|nr:SVM family protein, predicted signal peptide [Candidatus Phytoplasma rubi]